MTSPRPGLDLRVPPIILAILLVFFLTHLTAIMHMRGVADPEGFLLNTSKNIPINSYEDDGTVSVFHALGYYGETNDTFSIATNFGGPLLHLAKPVMWLGEATGLIKRFDDPRTYLAFPNELTRIWKLFAAYKLVLLLLLPLSLYWLGKNFHSETAGVIAAALVSCMPFATGFELRLKPDGLCMAVALLSLLHQLEYMRSARKKNLYWAAAFMALTFSMKFTVSSIGPLFILSFFEARRIRDDKVFSRENLILLAKASALSLVVFLAANPRFLAGVPIFLDFVNRYTNIPERADVPGGLFYTLGFRLLHYDAFFGFFANLLVLPSLAFLAWRTTRDRFRVTPVSFFLALYVLQMFFLWKVAHNHLVLDLPYYYYGQAILTVFAIALFLAWLMEISRGRLLLRGACVLLALATVGATFSENVKVLRFLSGPSTRQAAHAWIDENLPTGASIGAPLDKGDHFAFRGRIMLDPFRYRIAPLGRKGEYVREYLPDYVLWVRMNALEPRFEDLDYELVAEFDLGEGLAREAYNFYQDDIYQVFRKKTGAPAGALAPPNGADYFIGQLARRDPEKSFNILQYQASYIYPISLDIFEKERGRVRAFPTGAFAGAIRHDSSAWAFPHQVPPTALTLWGVKYLVAKTDDQIRNNLAGSKLFAFERLEGPEVSGAPEGVAVYANKAYMGEVFFVPAPDPELVYRQKERYLGLLSRHRLKSYGTLYPASLRARATAPALRVRMAVSCDGAMDLIFKDGARRQSVYLGPGLTEVDAPYELGEGAGDVGYEINPAEEGASCAVLSFSAEPFELSPVSGSPFVTLEQAFAMIETDVPGEAVFAAPYATGWTAQADGRLAPVLRGCANTTAVPVEPGKTFISLRYD